MSTRQKTRSPHSGIANPLDQAELQLRDDYEWALRDKAIQRKHAGKVVAVHDKQIWGVGTTHFAALKKALDRPGCPSRQQLALVHIEGEPVA